MTAGAFPCKPRSTKNMRTTTKLKNIHELNPFQNKMVYDLDMNIFALICQT